MFFRRRIHSPYEFNIQDPRFSDDPSDAQFHAGEVVHTYDVWATLGDGKDVLDAAVRELDVRKRSETDVFCKWSESSLRAAFSSRVKTCLPEGLMHYNFYHDLDIVEAAALPRVARCDAELASTRDLRSSGTTTPEVTTGTKSDSAEHNQLLDTWIDCMMSLEGTDHSDERRPWFSRPARGYLYTSTARWPYSDVMSDWIWIHILAETESAHVLALSKELKKLLWRAEQGVKPTTGITHVYAERRLIQRVWQALVLSKQLWQWGRILQPTAESGQLVSQTRGFHNTADGLVWPDEVVGSASENESDSSHSDRKSAGDGSGLLCCLVVVGALFAVAMVVGILVFFVTGTRCRMGESQVDWTRESPAADVGF